MLAAVAGEANVVEPPPQMGAEDFSYYQKEMPGVFFFLGVRNEAQKITAMVHTEYFDLDEDTLQLGVRAHELDRARLPAERLTAQPAPIRLGTPRHRRHRRR